MLRAAALGVVASFAIGVVAPATAGAQEVDKKIQRVWKAKCASCHGADGKGETDQGKKMKVRDMTTPAYQKEVTDDRIKKALAEGVKNKDGEMEAYGDLKPEQVDGLVQMVRSFKK